MMIMMARFIVYSILFCVTYAQNDTELIFKYVDNNKTVSVKDCIDCLTKCCRGTQIILENNSTCVDNKYNITIQDFDVSVFKNDVKKEIIQMKKTLKNFRFVYEDSGAFWGEDAYKIESDDREPMYLLEDGSLAFRQLNYLNQWPYPPYTFTEHCLEIKASVRNGSIYHDSIRLIHRVRPPPDEEEEDEYKELKKNIKASAMVISSFFLLLTLLAYAVLPQKRNLPALMLMTYVSCLMTTFVFRAIQVFKDDFDKEWCTFIGLVLYTTFWASFTWMNVMSYDMWRTTCTMFGRHLDPPRKILSKFLWYSVYGFGVPLLMAAFLVGIDHADLSSVPGFVKPQFVALRDSCYFATEDERRLYVNGPVLVATVINIVFFVMTALYIWRNSAKPGGTGDSRNTKKDTNRFAIYLKLVIITGITWILDVLGAVVDPHNWAWLAVDIFNSLSGVFIFLLFIFKKELLGQLCTRFGIQTRFNRKSESTMVTSVSVTKRSRELSYKEAGTNEQKPEFLSERAGFI